MSVDTESCPSWSKEHDWKSCKLLKRFRGFESLALRQVTTATLIQGCGCDFSIIILLTEGVSAMKFDSINKKFSDYEIERGNEQGVEYIAILKNGFREPIKVYYESDMQEYIVTFATQHLHISEDEDLIDIVSKFADASIAAIEFYENGKNSFGGQIETNLLENLSYDTLRIYFGYPHLDISQKTFRIYAWNKEYCFEGSFVKSASNTFKIIKKNYAC